MLILPPRHNLAVVQRRAEPAKSLDYFPTPPWATRAFVQHVALPVLEIDPGAVIEEPACGEGHMAAALLETFSMTSAADIFPYGYGAVRDFLAANDNTPDWTLPDWLITNPPFNQAIKFAQHGLRLARKGVCLLVRTSWLHTLGRYRLFSQFEPYLIAYYVERVPMHRGRWLPNGKTATDYCWVCWRFDAAPRAPLWIPPGQRKALTRPDDAARFGAQTPAPLLEERAA